MFDSIDVKVRYQSQIFIFIITFIVSSGRKRKS